jgi:hypothetical protein
MKPIGVRHSILIARPAELQCNAVWMDRCKPSDGPQGLKPKFWGSRNVRAEALTYQP